MRQHRYEVTNRWTGNLGTGTSNYRAYSRNLELSTPAKSAPIPGSSDPLFRGDRSRYNPEELLVGALSACHMLWALHYCADAGIVVIEYVDEASGEMVERPDGSGEFTRVVLRPRMTITDRGAHRGRRRHPRAGARGVRHRAVGELPGGVRAGGYGWRITFMRLPSRR